MHHLSASYPDGGGAQEAQAAQAAQEAQTSGGTLHTAGYVPIPEASNRVAPDDIGGTGPMLPMQDLFDRTVSLLKRRDFQSADPRSFKGIKKRLAMMRQAGLPRMKLLPGKVLAELGRIPRSTEVREDGEPYTVDALEMIGREGSDERAMPKSIIAFFSHRWLRANFSTLHQRDVEWGSAEWLEATKAEGHYVGMPDSNSDAKVRDLIEWMRWLKWRTSRQRKFMGSYLTQGCKDIYFFIDWSCVDQTNPVAEICALPAFVSSCSLIASYFTEGYKGRAWCQAELLMARAFCALPVVMRVPVGFKHEEQLFLTSSQFTLPNPSDRETAIITNEDDRPAISALTKCARESKAFTYAQCARKGLSEPAQTGTVFGFVGSLITGIWVMMISCGLHPLLFRRNVVPGKSEIQLVEPCGARMPYSWSQVKLWFHLSPRSAVTSMYVASASLFCMGFSIYWLIERTDPTELESYVLGAFAMSLSTIAFVLAIQFFPPLNQEVISKTRERRMVAILVLSILLTLGLAILVTLEVVSRDSDT
jgi:hypothetical protein